MGFSLKDINNEMCRIARNSHHEFCDPETGIALDVWRREDGTWDVYYDGEKKKSIPGFASASLQQMAMFVNSVVGNDLNETF